MIRTTERGEDAMIGALLVGFVAGVVGRMLMPNDAFRDMSGPASWGVSILVGLAGALVGYLIFTLGLGIGDDDIFDWGGIVGAIIGVAIVLAVVGWFVNRRSAKRATTAGPGPRP
jgi:uncharacterized membrane protein YeaQ/YmgE (transglycosylase-associated protein family)